MTKKKEKETVTSDGETILKISNKWDGVTVTQKKGDDLVQAGGEKLYGQLKKALDKERYLHAQTILSLKRIETDFATLVKEKDDLRDDYREALNTFHVTKDAANSELAHEKYLHGLASEEIDKLLEKRKLTVIEVKRLREQNQTLRGDLAQAFRKINNLSQPWWKRFRKNKGEE